MTVPISARLPRDLIEAMDDERKLLEFAPTRTEVLERALREWVANRRQQRSGASHVRQL